MKQTIEKILGLFSKKGEILEERKPLMRPFHDWVVLFVVVVLGIILITLFCTYMFFGIEGGGFFVEKIESTPPKVGFEESELTKTLENYNKKKEEFEKRTSENKTISDPAI